MTDNRTTELLPCPFCGGEANTQIFDKTLNVGCPRCDIRTRFMLHDDLEQAIDAWNTRAELGSGTCELVETYSYSNSREVVHVLECSACGKSCEHVNGNYPRCPHCGAKAVER